jgi:hypothetical protein
MADPTNEFGFYWNAIVQRWHYTNGLLMVIAVELSIIAAVQVASLFRKR